MSLGVTGLTQDEGWVILARDPPSSGLGLGPSQGKTKGCGGGGAARGGFGLLR